MNTSPIFFSAPMVRAILAGEKTQTRRVVKTPNDGEHATDVYYKNGHCCFDFVERDFNGDVIGGGQIGAVKCPYGQVGDILWVKETHRIAAWEIESPRFAFDYKASPEQIRSSWCTMPEGWNDTTPEDWHIKIADELSAKGIEPNEDGDYEWEKGDSPLSWRPSIFMPEWASRIKLQITNVRVERLQDITVKDVIAEGGPPRHNSIDRISRSFGDLDWPRSWFAQLWDDINTSRNLGWATNPWVWVVEFKVLEVAK